MGNKISVFLKDIVEPEDCQAGQAPARAVADLGTLPSGYYELTIDLKGTVVNRGQLTVLGNRYSLDMRTTEGFLLLNRELLRVPANTVWGYIAYPNGADSESADRFIRELEAASQLRDFADGYYGYFRIADQGSTITLLEAPPSGRFLPFIFHYEGATGSLREMIHRYQSEPGRTLDVRLYTSTGEILD